MKNKQLTNNHIDEIVIKLYNGLAKHYNLTPTIEISKPKNTNKFKSN